MTHAHARAHTPAHPPPPPALQPPPRFGAGNLVPVHCCLPGFLPCASPIPGSSRAVHRAPCVWPVVAAVRPVFHTIVCSRPRRTQCPHGGQFCGQQHLRALCHARSTRALLHILTTATATATVAPAASTTASATCSYVNLDDAWMAPMRDRFGNLQVPDTHPPTHTQQHPPTHTHTLRPAASFSSLSAAPLMPPCAHGRPLSLRIHPTCRAGSCAVRLRFVCGRASRRCVVVADPLRHRATVPLTLRRGLRGRRAQGDLQRFPSGMKWLSQQVHARGLKLGL